MKFPRLKSPFFIAVAAVFAVTILIIVCAVSCNAGKIHFKNSYYFILYSMEDNSLSASSISSAVRDFGGAGYILEYNGVYYVTISCYYEKKDADKVCAELQNRAFGCRVLEIKTNEYRLQSAAAKKYAKLYEGNLNTLHSLSKIAYECANFLDTGEYGQEKAKSVLKNIKSGLDGLASTNTNNCFSNELSRLKALTDDTANGYVYSKDLRKLQIAVLDTVININLF
ncbi:MAG: hypothetical protein K2I20_05550 [Clostridia bacterium]|nr:hypothetical protein [Clostridia bacterium]